MCRAVSNDRTATNLLRLLRTDGFTRFVSRNRGSYVGFHLSQPLHERLVLSTKSNHLVNINLAWRERGQKSGRYRERRGGRGGTSHLTENTRIAENRCARERRFYRSLMSHICRASSLVRSINWVPMKKQRAG